MARDQLETGSPADTHWLGGARDAAGLSPRRLARRTGIPKRRLLAFERGEETPTPAERQLLATACGLTGPVPAGDAATREVLEEYVAMIAELRHTTPDRFGPLRQEDIAVLADAFGHPPELVEARLVQLLASGDRSADPSADPSADLSAAGEPGDPTCD